MRCPKCGYISFDYLETCKKCSKPAIGKLSEEIRGTIYDAVAPGFLVFGQVDEAEVPQEVAVETEVEVDELLVDDGDEDDFILSLSEEEEDITAAFTEVSEPEQASEEDDFVLSLDEQEDAPLKEEFTLDLGGEEQEGEEEGPTFDFSELDISDLMPPGEEKIEEVAEKEITIDVKEPEPHEEAPAVELESREEAEAAPSREAEKGKDVTGGLEDLLLDELDLDTVAAAPVGKGAVSPVKTGTALDNFDVDLGELFKEDE